MVGGDHEYNEIHYATVKNLVGIIAEIVECIYTVSVTVLKSSFEEILTIPTKSADRKPLQAGRAYCNLDNTNELSNNKVYIITTMHWTGRRKTTDRPTDGWRDCDTA